MPELTIFTAPKAFTNPHIALIQRNAIRSWLSLGDQVEVILLGEEDGLAEFAAECGSTYLPEVARNANGTPLVSSMFDLARRNSTSPLLCCVNADVLMMPDVVQGAMDTARLAEKFLIVGQRWDLDVRDPLEFTPGWPERLRLRARTQGKLHRASGSDYFIFPRDCFKEMPAFAIGRAGWDNWMIYEARQRGWKMVDGSMDINIIHQDHDYRHLPNGKPHYKLPESFDNVKAGGGRRTVFTLDDCDMIIKNGKLDYFPMSWKKLWREVEIIPLVRWHSQRLANFFFAVFHPQKAYREWRSRNQT